MIDKVVKVNLGSEGVVPIIKITIGDDMWRFHFQVYNDSKRWAIPNDVNATLSGKKPDGTSFDVGCTISDNEILADCSKEMTDIPGMSYALLKIYDSDEKLVNSCKISIFCASDTPCAGYGRSYYVPSSPQGGGSTTGGYVKPPTGIPKGDLARDVQNALDPEIFIAVYGSTTQAALDSAYSSEKPIFLKDGRNIYPFAESFIYTSGGTQKRGYRFVSYQCDDGSIEICELGENGWKKTQMELSDGEVGSADDKVDIYQGTENAGKFLAVGADGNVTLVSASSVNPGDDQDDPNGLIVEDENGNMWVFLEGIGDSGDIAITDEDGNYWHMPSGQGSSDDIQVGDDDGHVWHIVAKTNVSGGSGSGSSDISTYGGLIPFGGSVGDILMKTSNGIKWVSPAGDFTGDNTRPITAAAVYTEIGNINALLATI